MKKKSTAEATARDELELKDTTRGDIEARLWRAAANTTDRDAQHQRSHDGRAACAAAAARCATAAPVSPLAARSPVVWLPAQVVGVLKGYDALLNLVLDWLSVSSRWSERISKHLKLNIESTHFFPF